MAPAAFAPDQGSCFAAQASKNAHFRSLVQPLNVALHQHHFGSPK
jgi:hypothetical protein